MIDLQKIKESIENNTLNDSLLILNAENNSFLAQQYYHRIKKCKQVKIIPIDNLDDIVNTTDSIFEDTAKPDCFYTHICDTFEYTDEALKYVNNVLIMCNKIAKNAKELFKDYIINFPKLEDWQIQDYIYSIAEGVNVQALDWLNYICKKDLFRITAELDKVRIFSIEHRQQIFDDLIKDKAFEDLSANTVFDLSNSLLAKNLSSLFKVYQEITNMDVDAIGLTTILYNNFKNVLCIQLSASTTAQTLGVSDKQFYAIKRNTGFYNKQSLCNILDTITLIDFKLKTGQLPADMIIDYLIIKILNN